MYNLEETFAVSSQWMNRNNYRVILEEIFKANEKLRKSLPHNVDSFTPAEKVAASCAHTPLLLNARHTLLNFC